MGHIQPFKEKMRLRLVRDRNRQAGKPARACLKYFKQSFVWVRCVPELPRATLAPTGRINMW